MIEWEDIEDYVDAAIDRKLLEADIQRAKNTLDNTRSLERRVGKQGRQA